MLMVDSGGLPPGEARIDEGVCVPERRESICPIFDAGVFGSMAVRYILVTNFGSGVNLMDTNSL